MPDLGASWDVLETEAGRDTADRVRTVEPGLEVQAGPVLLGVDAGGHRHLLIPLRPGEGFAEDRSGSGVQLRRISIDGETMASLVCLERGLNEVFERLCLEVLRVIDGANSPATEAAETLAAWKRLLSLAGREALGDEQLVGLLGELLVLEQLLRVDPLRRIEPWTGPDGSQHDFTYENGALEVKATTVREGRVVGIHGVQQLDPNPSPALHLIFMRFERAPAGAGWTLPEVIARLEKLGVDALGLRRKLSLVGYAPQHDDSYNSRPVVLREQRVYDVNESGFPRITGSSFIAGTPPPGTLRFRYAIDLTNEPPMALAEGQVAELWSRLAVAG